MKNLETFPWLDKKMCVLKSTFKIPLQGPFELTYPVFQLAFGICIASLEKVSIVKTIKRNLHGWSEGRR